MTNDILALQLMHPLLIWIMLGLLGLSVGSFINVIIYRLPKMLAGDESINLCFPRSFCPHCKKIIAAYRNIPLLSFLFQKGRCANCHQHISFIYPATELSALLLTLLTYGIFGLSYKLIFALLFIWIALALVVIDIKYLILPDVLTLSLLWLGLLANSFDLFCNLKLSVYAAMIGYLIPWLSIKLYAALTGKIGMGHGDFKLMAAIGAFLGPLMLPFVLLISAFLGMIVGGVILKINKRNWDHPIPFGPFLCFAGAVMLLWGDTLMRLYFKSLGI